jgi:zinc transport system substrate-binding protein
MPKKNRAIQGAAPSLIVPRRQRESNGCNSLEALVKDLRPQKNIKQIIFPVIIEKSLKMRQKLFINLLLLTLLIAPAVSAAPVPVLVSILPQKWLAEQIGGNLITVRVLLEKGQEPHGMEPTPEQLTALFRSRLYFALGLEFERGLLEKIKKAASKVEIINTVAAIKKIPMTEHDEHEHGHAGLDPHVWLDPQNLKKMASSMAHALVAADPSNAAAYQQNLETVSKELTNLYKELQTKLAPFKGQSFLVFHPAFGYFAHAFGLRQEAVEIEGKSPAPKQLYELIAKAKKEKVKVIFVQPQFDRKNAATIAQAIGGKVAALDPLAENVPENLRSMAEQISSALRKNSTKSEP